MPLFIKFAETRVTFPSIFHPCVDVELRGVVHGLLNLALLRGTYQCLVIFFREIRGNLDFQIQLFQRAGHTVGFHALYDPDAFSGQLALLAETQHVNPRAGADGGEE